MHSNTSQYIVLKIVSGHAWRNATEKHYDSGHTMWGTGTQMLLSISQLPQLFTNVLIIFNFVSNLGISNNYTLQRQHFQQVIIIVILFE